MRFYHIKRNQANNKVTPKVTLSFTPYPLWLRKKESRDETQFTTKIDGKTSLGFSLLFRFVKFDSQLRI
jgi:hypothetical protein